MVSQKSSKIFFMMILLSMNAGSKRAKNTQRQSRSGALMKIVGLKSLLLNSRIQFSKKMENLKNISLVILTLIRILKNWKDYFQFTGVYLYTQVQSNKKDILKRNVEKFFMSQN